MQLVILYTATPVFFRFTITRIGSATGKSSITQLFCSSQPTRQELIGYFNVRRRLRNISQRVNRHTNGLHNHRFLLICIIRNVIINLLRFLDGGIENVIDIIIILWNSSLNSSIFSISRYSSRKQRESDKTRIWTAARHRTTKKNRDKRYENLISSIQE